MSVSAENAAANATANATESAAAHQTVDTDPVVTRDSVAVIPADPIARQRSSRMPYQRYSPYLSEFATATRH
jgi:hypothetical protein